MIIARAFPGITSSIRRPRGWRIYNERKRNIGARATRIPFNAIFRRLFRPTVYFKILSDRIEIGPRLRPRFRLSSEEIGKFDSFGLVILSAGNWLEPRDKTAADRTRSRFHSHVSSFVRESFTVRHVNRLFTETQLHAFYNRHPS